MSQVQDTIRVTWQHVGGVSGFHVYMDRLDDNRYVEMDVPAAQRSIGMLFWKYYWARDDCGIGVVGKGCFE